MWKILINKNTKSKYSIVFGIFLAFILLFLYLNLTKATDINLALGNNNKTTDGLINNKRIHCHTISQINECIVNFKKAGADKDLILWLGNSQLHAINSYVKGQKSASQLLHKKLLNNNEYLMTISLPNASLEEHFFLLLYLKGQVPIKKIILSIVYDDTRENLIRDNLLSLLEKNKKLINLKDSFAKKRFLEQTKEKQSINNFDLDTQTLQKQVENFLNNKLSSFSNLWASRINLKSEVYIFFYKLRNSIFNINPESVRRKIPGVYEKNILALKSLKNNLVVSNIEGIFYIAPIRSDINLPYDKNDYLKFKDFVKSMENSKNIHFSNLETLVPGKMWGTKDNTKLNNDKEIDFMHFKSEGHQILTNALFDKLVKELQ